MVLEPRWSAIQRSALVGIFLTAVFFAADLPGDTPTPTPPPWAPGHESALRLRLKPLPEGVRRIRLEASDDGEHRFVLVNLDGTEERLTPDAFASRLDHDHHNRRRLYSLLNITSPIGIAWVVLGLAGQVLFAGRMIVQWVVSERRQRSTVPVAFWWMSLGGASMLLAYFIWRRDIVGILGQGTGWLIYCRNLWLISKNRAPRPD